ncbi:hypothetical protein [Pyrobaculum aerophilum]|uniref:Uncharacterized protein n=2 Tax=Pyrobaculum aerophilum TaxID=13773 RepID=Q8ZVS3_PYRAE|nr:MULTISPECIES: hypothetical protein [Pyrobaculum]AAL63983.1 hypothetical protein PAE2149 [Pyrobaculum aerophilum str. IM2]MCX8136423.1 hypothetical protein [Pyrobaculum aerophilum]HII47248.1 hypothetical protein [Pyrobaculum aerophilum]
MPARFVIEIWIYAMSLLTIVLPLYYVNWNISKIPLPLAIVVFTPPVIIITFFMPKKFLLENGVVKLCSLTRCKEYQVLEDKGFVDRKDVWKRYMFCSGWRFPLSAWALCPDGNMYFSTLRCNDKWRVLRIKNKEEYTLWLCG